MKEYTRLENKTYGQLISLPFLLGFQEEKPSIRPAVYFRSVQFPLLRLLWLSCSVHFPKSEILDSLGDRKHCWEVATWSFGPLSGSTCYVPLLARAKDGTCYCVADQRLLAWIRPYPYPSQQTSNGTHLCHLLHFGWARSGLPGVLDVWECQGGYLCRWLRCYDYRPVSNCYSSQIREEGY